MDDSKCRGHVCARFTSSHRTTDPLYKDQTYRLKFMFSQSYPIEAPEVVFVRDETHPIPMHPHIYSNGIICLDLLDRTGWSPVHNVESVCVSLQSMLTSNTKDERPPGDDAFVRHNTQRPRDINFVFHDSTVSLARDMSSVWSKLMAPRCELFCQKRYHQ